MSEATDRLRQVLVNCVEVRRDTTHDRYPYVCATVGLRKDDLTALLDEVERLTRERDDACAELERLREEMASVVSVAQGYEETNRRLRAEVERLRDELDRMRPHAEGCNWMRRGDAYPCSCITDADRLRHALRGLLVRVDDGSDYGEGHAVAVARAALTGAPSETRREQDRTIAERVRERIALALFKCKEHALADALDRRLACGQRTAEVRALDLDALLEEP